MKVEAVKHAEVKNVVFLVLTSGIAYGGITSYCNMYYEEFGADINFYFIYTDADYSKGLRNTIDIKDCARINDLFNYVLNPSDTVIISTRIWIFNDFFRSYPAISIKYPVIVEHHANMISYLNESKWLTGHFLPEHTRMSAINAIKVFTKAEAFELRKFFSGKILCVPNPSPYDRAQINYNPQKVIFVARLDEADKNLTMLTDVVKELERINSDITVHIYGDGPDRGVLDEISNVALLHGKVDDKEQIYSDACVMISTSNREGFSISILEAASYGIPVISTRHSPSVCEFIEHGENGYLIDSGQVNEFSRAINELCLNKELRQHMSQCIKSTALAHSKDIVMNKYLNEMRECIMENELINKLGAMESAVSYFSKCYSYKLKENDMLKNKLT